MKQGLPWSPCHHHSLLIAPCPSLTFPILKIRRFNTISATAESTETQTLTARERRQLRNKIRESKPSNWREVVEEKLLQKPKPPNLSELLNLNTLADLGPQWWILRISGTEKNLHFFRRDLARHHPDFEYEIFSPAINVKRKLKNGTISVRQKRLYSGKLFIRCVLNTEINKFINSRPGVYGFEGFNVGNNERKINRPEPASIKDMEAVYRAIKAEQEVADKAFEEEQQKVILKAADKAFEEEQLKVEQKAADIAFEEEQQRDETIQSDNISGVTHQDSNNVTVSTVDTKPKRKSRKKSSPLENNEKHPAQGSTVQIVSGAFAEFSGSVKMLNHKTGKVTVGVTVFGKESLVDLDVSEIVAEKN